MRTKLLFICSRNQWRSPTAEALFRTSQAYEARSAGTSQQARTRVNDGHIRWADRIFVMEIRHRQLMLDRFGQDLRGRTVTVLDIPDDYRFMDAELTDLLRARLSSLLTDIEWPS